MSLKTSLRVLDKTTPVQDDNESVLSQMLPWAEKLIKTPQGLGVVMIVGGILLRMTHTSAQAVVTSQDTIPIAGVGNETFNQWKVIPPSDGLDQVVFKIPLSAVSSYVSTLEQGFAGGPIMAIAGMFGWHIQNNNMQDVSGNVAVMLSDVLILAGAGVFLGSSLGGLASLIPKA